MIKVYKRDDGPDDGHICGPEGYLRSRPWMVGPTPEDSRKTCWPDWDEAMRWATDTEYRAARIEQDAREDGGW